MIYLAIIGAAVLYGVWRFTPLTRDLYVSEETRSYYAIGRPARSCAFVDWSAWSDKGDTENIDVLDSER